MVRHTYDPSTWEVETGGSEVQGLSTESEASRSYAELSLKTTTELHLKDQKVRGYCYIKQRQDREKQAVNQAAVRMKPSVETCWDILRLLWALAMP